MKTPSPGLAERWCGGANDAGGKGGPDELGDEGSAPDVDADADEDAAGVGGVADVAELIAVGPAVVLAIGTAD